MRRIWVAVGVIGIAAGSSFAQEAARPALKKRAAVATFEDKTDRSWHWWTGKGVGEGMADMLTTALVKSGRYVVMERQELAKILEEQKLGQAGVLTAETAPQAGKVLGVELLLMGAVTEFGYKQSEKGGGIRRLGIGGGMQSKSATVAVDVRFVNTTTSEIMAAETVRKEKSSKGIAIATSEGSFGNEKDFDDSLVGKATREAIDDLVKLIDTQMEKVPWSGRIIDARPDGSIFINRGSNFGVKPGDVFAVFREGEELVDPETGISLGKEESKIGTVEVVADLAQGKAAKALVKSGTGIRKGDIIRLP